MGGTLKTLAGKVGGLITSTKGNQTKLGKAVKGLHKSIPRKINSLQDKDIGGGIKRLAGKVPNPLNLFKKTESPSAEKASRSPIPGATGEGYNPLNPGNVDLI